MANDAKARKRSINNGQKTDLRCSACRLNSACKEPYKHEVFQDGCQRLKGNRTLKEFGIRI